MDDAIKEAYDEARKLLSHYSTSEAGAINRLGGSILLAAVVVAQALRERDAAAQPRSEEK